MDAIKTIYQACMNTDRLRSMQGREIVEAIKVQEISYIIF